MLRSIGFVLATVSLGAVGVVATADVPLTTFQAGTVISSSEVNQNFQALNEGKQDRIADGCPAGSAIRTVESDGSVACVLVGSGGSGDTYTAGAGLDLDGLEFSVEMPLQIESDVPMGASDPESAALSAVNASTEIGGVFGVYGEAAGNTQVTGIGAGVKGRSIGSSAGVFGEAGDTSDFSVLLGPIGVVGMGTNRGVAGSSRNGSALFGTSVENYGVWGQSTNWRGVTGRTLRGDDNYGVYTPDNLYAANVATSGAIVMVARNGGNAVEPGSLVAFTGVDRPAELADTVVSTVASLASAPSESVAGVVLSRYDLAAATAEEDGGPRPGGPTTITPSGAVPAGEYLLMVVAGPAQVTLYGGEHGIGPGDALAPSVESGLGLHVREAERVWEEQRSVQSASTESADMPAWSVFGKALEAVPPFTTRTVYAFVNGF